jgi:cell division septal protein FtsQ
LSLKIGLPVAVLVGLIFLLRANFLQVKSFEVLGAETISQESIKNTASGFVAGNQFFLIPRSDILLLNKNKLASALLSKFGRIEKVEVNKKIFSESIELKITERKADFLWCSLQDECFFMTKEGFIFEKFDATPTLIDKIIFRGLLEGNPLMKNFATPEKMQNYSNLIDTFKNANFEVSSINIESSDRALAKTNIGDVIFNPEEADLSLVAQNTILLINETKNKNPSARFQYIDARFGNKLFYKLY